MTTLRNTVSGFASAAAMALGLATFVPANPALAATFATTDAAELAAESLRSRLTSRVQWPSFHLAPPWRWARSPS